MSVDIQNLERGKRYVFHTRSWESPFGETILGCAKERIFIGFSDIGAVGMQTIPFVEVEHDNGRRHLIAVETIETIESQAGTQ